MRSISTHPERQVLCSTCDFEYLSNVNLAHYLTSTSCCDLENNEKGRLQSNKQMFEESCQGDFNSV